MTNFILKIKYLFFFLLTFGLIFVSFVYKKENNIIFDISSENRFLNSEEIFDLTNDIINDSSIIDLNYLEEKIKSNKFIKDIEIYNNLNNVVNININQFKPYARLINNIGDDYYIDKNGEIFPVSNKYSERVLLIFFKNYKNIDKEKNINFFQNGNEIFKLINYINRNDFYKKQISQINVLKDGEIIMIPQITKQKIYFGNTDNMEIKFKKLELFYKNILPTKGWNYYESVNLKFKNQIVCNKSSNV
ncbi:MAG: hypothetical protein CL871_04915 [Cytophagia bacterium]|nr:hypothetical protein [Cytophagia bacterium]|tara:strand:- start:2082 stop:2822 length:741 start_codon:yes stop_codon:yes gene_type:complete